jgi:hypothetical protein
VWMRPIPPSPPTPLQYTISGVAVGGSLYGLTFNDTNVIAPTDYILFWLRYNPGPGLSRPPAAQQDDPSLLYILGDSTTTTRTHEVRLPAPLWREELPRTECVRARGGGRRAV